jgi:hypothetical protein
LLQAANSAFFCSQLSRKIGEPIFATASRHDVWFLLEYKHYWYPQVLPQSDLPSPVKIWLSSNLRATPRSRLLFIKQTSRHRSELTFYLAISHELKPVLYEFPLEKYEDLLDIDIATALKGDEPSYDKYISEQPLFLVCTHGKHDKCCAKNGQPIYRELAKRGGEVVWQCSHVGGDRFAANLICLPHGLYYGRVEKDDLPLLLKEFQHEKIYFDKFRGRSCYNMLVQAADHFLRSQTGIGEIFGLRLLKSERLEQNNWRVVFASRTSDAAFAVYLSEEQSQFRHFLTCSATRESTVPQYNLVKIELI